MVRKSTAMRSLCLRILLSLAIALSLFTIPGDAICQSRYVTLSYADPALLREFNKNLYLGRKLSAMMRKQNIITIEDEVNAKIDVVVEKVEVALDMFPNKLHFKLVILPTANEVSGVYKSKYGKSVNHIAYYSLTEKTIYISAKNTRLKVLAHEIGHMVVDHFFTVRPPYNVHELLAQFAEKHVTD